MGVTQTRGSGDGLQRWQRAANDFLGSDNDPLHKLAVLPVGPGELLYSHRCTRRTVESLEHSPMGTGAE